MSISIVFARSLLSQVHSAGGDARALLESCAIEAERLTDLREMLSAYEAERLMLRALELTQDPALGLTMGRDAPETMLQVVGHAMLAEHTLRGAFSTLRQYSELLADGLTWSLIEEGATARLACEVEALPNDALRSAWEFALLMLSRMMLHFAPASALCQVQFQHALPRYGLRYGEFFRCPVLFGQPDNALIFSREALDLVQAHGDETVRLAFGMTAHRMLTERAQGRSLAQRVRVMLCNTRSLSDVNVARLASRVGLSPRALRRRLGTEGTPLSGLLDEARCRIACEELRRPDTTIKATAELLGFSEPSAFHRAFKRWTGRTPARYAELLDLRS